MGSELCAFAWLRSRLRKGKTWKTAACRTEKQILSIITAMILRQWRELFLREDRENASTVETGLEVGRAQVQTGSLLWKKNASQGETSHSPRQEAQQISSTVSIYSVCQL
jgi:hypothetical protein